MCSKVVSLSVPKLACKFIRCTNDTAYLTHNEGVKFCGNFSETSPLQSQHCRLLRESAIFPSNDKVMLKQALISLLSTKRVGTSKSKIENGI